MARNPKFMALNIASAEKVSVRYKHWFTLVRFVSNVICAFSSKNVKITIETVTFFVINFLCLQAGTCAIKLLTNVICAF